MTQTTRTKPWLSVMALLLSLAIPVFIFAQGGGGGGYKKTLSSKQKSIETGKRYKNIE